MQKTSVSVLQNLRHLKENPPSLHVSLSAEVQNSLESTAKPNLSSLETGGKPLDSNEPMDAIDWNISADDTQIDWDIGTAEQPEEPGDAFGSYEIIDANIDLRDSENGNGVVSDHTMLNKGEEGVISSNSESEICWEIGIQNPQNEDVVLPDLSSLNELRQPECLAEGRSQLLDTEYRNKILDDLFEVLCYFLISLGIIFLTYHFLSIYFFANA